MKVLVIMGGLSAEREVSLRSGNAVADAVRELGYELDYLDLSRDNLHQIRQIAPDVVFIALHGPGGEDGTLQGYLNLLGLPYTGSGVLASALCMNKVLTKKIMISEGIPTPPYRTLTRAQALDSEYLRRLTSDLGWPLVIKPNAQGSSIGTSIIKDEGQLQPALEQAFAYNSEILAEQFIAGKEITVPLMGNNAMDTEVLPIIEIVAENDFYDYESKYTQGMSNHIIPARISESSAGQAGDFARRLYLSTGCRGFARIDMILDQNGNPYVLEVNTIPGLTELSLVPDAARAAGMSFTQFIGKVIDLALE